MENESFRSLALEELHSTEVGFLESEPLRDGSKGDPVTEEETPAGVVGVELVVMPTHPRLERMSQVWRRFVGATVHHYASPPALGQQVWPYRAQFHERCDRLSIPHTRPRQEDFEDNGFVPCDGPAVGFRWQAPARWNLVFLLDGLSWRRSDYGSPLTGLAELPPGSWVITLASGRVMYPRDFPQWLDCWRNGPGRAQDRYPNHQRLDGGGPG